MALQEDAKQIMGRIIREARKAQKLTQKQLGLKMGYSESSAERIIQHWESGSQPVPLEQLKQLAKVLGTTVDNLLP